MCPVVVDGNGHGAQPAHRSWCTAGEEVVMAVIDKAFASKTISNLTINSPPATMAKTQTISKFLRLFTTLLYLTTAASAKHDRFGTLSSRSKLGLKAEKLTHLQFYFHDIFSGRNPTAVRVAEAAMTRTSPSLFGAMIVFDDPLTAGPDVKSRMVGRAQGIYATASQNEAGLLMVMNFAFMDGNYNGSTLTVLGRNTVFSAVREMPILGGSGLFRFARGHSEARTHFLNTTGPPTTGDAIVKYDVYVFHY
ncbi:dirigent protein 23-like [Tripterygium wilfordii]|uniref:dirigent protein 23-like n=1 Tax=Tripterygium wilfordii TaxID=458696 RepID=UPI0018F8041F|nr:dirigent protein 23-like [Tripterygium wilfordii]